MRDILVAKHIGAQVEENRRKDKEGVLMCPVCKIDHYIIQPLSSFGDNRDVLFCPHCDLTVVLTVYQNPETNEAYND